MPGKKRKECPTCGTKNEVEVQSCKQCGRRLSELVLIHQHSPTISFSSDVPGEDLPDDSQAVSPLKSFLRMFAMLIMLVIFIVPWVLLGRAIHANKNAVTSNLGSTQEIGTISHNNEILGVNDGSSSPIDIGRNPQEVTLKQQAALQMKAHDVQAAIALWQDALKIESNDAEALIYLEDQRVFTSGNPHITLIVGTAFTPPFPDTASEEVLQGAYVAQHQYNELHSNGTQLLLLIANSGDTANTSDITDVVQQIVQIAHEDPTVVGVIGWSGSASTLQALSVLSKAKIPLISLKASSDELSGSSSYFFRIVPPNIQEAQVGAMFAQNTLHVKNPVVFLDRGNAFSENLAHDFEQQFANVNANLPEEQFTTGSTTQAQFSTLIQDALKQHHADAFYFTSASNIDTGLFQDALPISTLPVIAGDGSYVAHLNSYGHWYFTTFAFHSESTISIAQQFAQAYSDDFNPYGQKPGGYYGYSLADDHAILSYDATSVALVAIGRAYAQGKTTLTPQDLADTLPQITGTNAFQGVSGQISFGANHDPIKKAIIILSVSKQGHIVLDNGIEGCFLKGSC